jgi:hypothetical protein
MSYGYAAFDVLIVPYKTDGVRRTWLLHAHLLIARRENNCTGGLSQSKMAARTLGLFSAPWALRYRATHKISRS